MAHIKTGTTTKGNRDSVSKRLGIKIYGGSIAKAGNIIVRQRGTKFVNGKGTGIGKDYTIFAMTDGVVRFRLLHGKKLIEVLPAV